MERKAIQSDRQIDDLTSAEMHVLWDEAKNRLN
jgi:hypothetical protein